MTLPEFTTRRSDRDRKEKMLAGELYRPGNAEIRADLATRSWLARYNVSLARSSLERWELLAERAGRRGTGHGGTAAVPLRLRL